MHCLPFPAFCSSSRHSQMPCAILKCLSGITLPSGRDPCEPGSLSRVLLPRGLWGCWTRMDQEWPMMDQDGPWGCHLCLPVLGRSWGWVLCSLSLCYLGFIPISLFVEMNQQELQKYNSWGKVAWNTASLREQQQWEGPWRVIGWEELDTVKKKRLKAANILGRQY